MNKSTADVGPVAALRLAQSLIAAALLIVGAGCSGSSSPSPQASAAASYSSSFSGELNRELQLRPVLVACFARHRLIPARDLDGRWYDGGHVITNRYWTEWWNDFNGLPVKVNGTWMHLADVARKAAEDGVWPTRLCGPLPSSSPAGS